ncbi:MAG: DUF6951 family protein [Eubacteriaceae bacterium]
MATAKVCSGICGFNTTIEGKKSEGSMVALEIKSDCSIFQKIGGELKEVDGILAVFSKLGEGPIWEACKIHCKHSGCPIPTAIIKVVEITSDLALPKDVSILLSK